MVQPKVHKPQRLLLRPRAPPNAPGTHPHSGVKMPRETHPTNSVAPSFPPRLPPLDPRSRTSHLPPPAPLPRGIISLQDAILALVRLTEGIPPLLAHALHLPDLADGLLELLHARAVVLDVVFLDLLDVVVGLWAVHALAVFPRDVAEET